VGAWGEGEAARECVAEARGEDGRWDGDREEAGEDDWVSDGRTDGLVAGGCVVAPVEPG
jgi:hypothetical protein